jgi:hypothetical protein
MRQQLINPFQLNNNSSWGDEGTEKKIFYFYNTAISVDKQTPVKNNTPVEEDSIEWFNESDF